VSVKRLYTQCIVCIICSSRNSNLGIHTLLIAKTVYILRVLCWCNYAVQIWHWTSVWTDDV